MAGNLVSQASFKTFKNGQMVLVAICDPNLLGETFREGKLKLEVSPAFYGGNLTSFDDAMRALEKADIGNLVGLRVVEEAIRRGLVDPEAVIRIAGVPHVQVVRL